MIKQVLALAFFILASLAAGFIGSFATMPNIDGWYDFLIKPDLNPPSWIFGPVWTLLYTLMGTAAYFVWRTGKGRRALVFFFAHLVVNTAWSLVFFGEQNILLAFGIIILLDLVIIDLIRRFYKYSKTAAYLLVPYLLWVLFATYLNGSIYFLNM